MSRLFPIGDTTTQAALRGFAALVLAGGFLAYMLGLFAIGFGAANEAVFPFAWRDVALVYLACAFPLGVILARAIHRRLRTADCLTVAACLLLMSVVGTVVADNAILLELLLWNPSLGAVLRTAVALGLATSAALAWRVLACANSSTLRAQYPRGSSAVMLALAVAVLLIPPTTYVGARCRHDLQRLGECLEQKRYGEAHLLAYGLLVLDATQKCNGGPMHAVAAGLGRTVDQLEKQVANPLAPTESPDSLLSRARLLAMLGRTDQALAALQLVQVPEYRPFVGNLRGTIYENRHAWAAALASYSSAHADWQKQPISPAKDEGLLTAAKGIAYCKRKLGRYAEAEAAYQEVLSLSPTADSHFLLAQFYEDAQQADKARVHARKAIALAPDRYGRQGEELIQKLAVYHFGCLGIARAERK